MPPEDAMTQTIALTSQPAAPSTVSSDTAALAMELDERLPVKSLHAPAGPTTAGLDTAALAMDVDERPLSISLHTPPAVVPAQQLGVPPPLQPFHAPEDATVGAATVSAAQHPGDHQLLYDVVRNAFLIAICFVHEQNTITSDNCLMLKGCVHSSQTATSFSATLI